MIDQNRIGSSFEDFLDDEGILEETTEVAIKRTIAWQIENCMKEQAVSKTKLAQTMRTSRAALNRLLDPENTSINLHTLIKAAHALGKTIEVKII